jgi:hypothetical protein
MPLMVYMSERGKTRRSQEGRGRRKVKQENRGWPRARIEAHERGEKWSGRGRGAPSWEDREEIPGNDWACGRSSSSNQAANDPSRTALQDDEGWNTCMWSNNNWGWKQ